MPSPYAEAFDYSRRRKINPMFSMSPSDCRSAQMFRPSWSATSVPGQTRKSGDATPTSATPPKADIHLRKRHVRKVTGTIIAAVITRPRHQQRTYPQFFARGALRQELASAAKCFLSRWNQQRSRIAVFLPASEGSFGECLIDHISDERAVVRSLVYRHLQHHNGD